MNELEKRSKFHKTKQHGLSPFCSLGENWADDKLDELKRKPKDTWTEDDWETYHYCKQANAEREFYDTLDESTESNLVVDFNFTKELMYEVEKHLSNNPDTRRLSGELDILNNHTFGILIENGDWKHEHIYLDHVVSQYLSSKGLDFEYFTRQVGTSDSDCYSAWHYYEIKGSTEPMLYDVEGDDSVAAEEAQKVADTLFTPVKCRGIIYHPNLKLEESYNVQFYQIFRSPTKPNENGKMVAQAGSVEEAHTKGKDLCGAGNYLIKAVCDDGKVRYVDNDFNESSRKKLIKDAGNVEHNIAMFNKAASPAEAPCTNPVSGHFGGNVEGKEAMGEAAEKKEPILYVIKDSHGNILSRPNEDDSELWDRVSSMEARGKRGLCVVVCTPDMLKKEGIKEYLTESAPEKETIELEYKNLEFTQYGPKRDADDWDEWDRCIDWTYEVDKKDLYSFIFESCIDETEFPPAFEDDFDPNNAEDWSKFESWLDTNFDAIYSKYKDKILDNWIEAATENAIQEYDPDDYVDWDSMPGGHDYYLDDLTEGEEVFMEKYSYGLNEEYKREPKMIDYFEQMNSEEEEV